MNGTVVVEFVGQHSRQFRPRWDNVDEFVTRRTETFHMRFAFDCCGRLTGFTHGRWFTFGPNCSYAETISRWDFRDEHIGGYFKLAKFVLNDNRVDALGKRIPAELARLVVVALNAF